VYYQWVKLTGWDNDGAEEQVVIYGNCEQRHNFVFFIAKNETRVTFRVGGWLLRDILASPPRASA
jgi:hypothetical protein